MKIKRYIIGFLLTIFPFFLFSQIEKNQNKQSNPKQERTVAATAQDPGVYSDRSEGRSLVYYATTGNASSIYFTGGWKEGVASLNDGTVLEGRLYRYNIYAQQMQFIHGDDTAAFAKPEELTSLTFDDHQFIYTTYKDEQEVKNGYFEVLTHGRCQLLLRREITYHLVDDLDDGIMDDSYVLEQSYYIRKKGEIISRIPLNKKCILSAFCDQEDAIKTYIKTNKIRFQNQEDMVRVVDYYNSLDTRD